MAWVVWGETATLSIVLLVLLMNIPRKSQIAIEYCYRFAERYASTWIFWVYCNNVARFNRSYQEIAERMQLPGHKDPEQDINNLVYNWLRNEGNGPWLMVLDNADDAGIFYPEGSWNDEPGKDTQRLSRYIPSTGHGLMLVTSRDRQAAFTMTASASSLIEVGPMTEEEAIELLLLKLPEKVSTSTAGELVQELSYLPLAIVKASSYISILYPEVTVSRYLTLFRQRRANQMSLLNRQFRDARRDQMGSNAVLTTWEISFQQIRQRNASATRLLSFMSFLDREKIPRALIHLLISDELEFIDAIGTLIAFSLVSVVVRDEDNTVSSVLYDLHALVQLATQSWLVQQGELGMWAETALLRLSEVFPTGEFETWETCALYLPHAQAILHHEETATRDRESRAELMNNVGGYIYELGRYGEAEKDCGNAWKIMSRVLGLDHPKTLEIMGMFALTLREQGKLAEARKLLESVVERCRATSGVENHQTLKHMNRLAMLYDRQDEYIKAESMYLEVLAIRSRLFERDHSDILATKHNLGILYRKQSRLEESVKLFTEVLEAEQKTLPPNHPDLLMTMDNLAMVYMELRQWDEAERLLLTASNAWKTLVGPEHPDTLVSMQELARLHRMRGDLEAGEAVQSYVTKTRRAVLGTRHADTLSSVHQLAMLWEEQDRLQDAIQLLEEVTATDQGDKNEATEARTSLMMQRLTIQLATLREMAYCKSRQEDIEKDPEADKGPVGSTTIKERETRRNTRVSQKWRRLWKGRDQEDV
jgi:tetratricopeptide (TPR) repeat protein